MKFRILLIGIILITLMASLSAFDAKSAFFLRHGRTDLLERDLGLIGDVGIHNDDLTTENHSDPYGNREWLNWLTSYQGTGILGGNTGKAICVGPDGRIFATGQVTATTPGYSNTPVVALDTDGSIDWSYEYDGGGFDMAFAIIADDDGNIYITGESDSPTGGFRFIIFSLDSEGVFRWDYHVNTPNSSAGFDIILAPDGHLYAAGVYDMGSPVQGFPGHAYLVSLTTEGVERWTHTYIAPDNRYSAFWALAADSDSNIYAAGSSNRDYFVYSVTSGGVHRWTESHSGSATGLFRDNEANDILVGGDGNVYVTGKFDEVGLSRVFMTMSFTPEGVLRWQHMHAGSYNAGDIAWAITEGPDGSIYVAGKGVETGFMDVWVVIKYTTLGVPLWTHFENPSPGINGLNSIVTDSQGNIYGCGWTSGGTGGGGPRFGALGLTPEGNLLFTHIITPAGNNGTGDQVVIGHDDIAYMVGFSGASMQPGELQVASFGSALEPPEFPAPENLVAVSGDGFVDLSWDPPSVDVLSTNDPVYNNRNLLGYNVYRDGEIINTETVEETAYSDTDVVNGVTYGYYVTALYDTGESQPSNSVEATPESDINPNPTVAHSPNPYDEAIDIPLDTPIGWTYTSDPLYTDPIGYKVNMWTEDPAGEPFTAFVPGGPGDYYFEQHPFEFEYETTYYWQVIPTTIEHSGEGRSCHSGVWVRQISDAFQSGLRGDAEDCPIWSFTTVTDSSIEVYDFAFGAELRKNYPNPFNPETVISFNLPQQEKVRLEVYNIRGQMIRTLLAEVKEPGEHVIVWDGRDDSGKKLSSGVYFYRLKTKEQSILRKMMMLK